MAASKKKASSKNSGKKLPDKTEILEELHRIEEIEYGTKELIHGIIIGIIIGFFLALVLMG